MRAARLFDLLVSYATVLTLGSGVALMLALIGAQACVESMQDVAMNPRVQAPRVTPWPEGPRHHFVVAGLGAGSFCATDLVVSWGSGELPTLRHFGPDECGWGRAYYVDHVFEHDLVVDTNHCVCAIYMAGQTEISRYCRESPTYSVPC